MKNYKRFLFFCGLVMAFSELCKQLSLTAYSNGTYDWWFFPFQLCSLPMYLALLYPLLKGRKIRQAFLTFMIDFCLLSGIFAFFDTSGMLYPVSWLTIHSYAWHILLIIIGIVSGLTMIRTKEATSFCGAAGIYLFGCGTATILNLTIGKYQELNMFYISPYYRMNQIVFSRIAEYTGNGFGILFYLCAILAGAGLFHLFWQAVQKICQR